ncbi:MAG: hypothetical protein H7296_09100 [Bacteroidia bacterium]|nr:hypothetical protein [Bacteroidia bacterium]
MKTLIMPALILTAICCLQNCRRDPCKGVVPQERITKFNIADSLKAAIPYNGKDTLIFVSETGDTARLLGTGYYNNYEDVQLANYSDCPGSNTKSRYEHVYMTFKGPNPSVNVITYEVYQTPDGISSVTGAEITINNFYHSVFNFEYSSFYKPAEDSIYINNNYAKGGYADAAKTILYNKEYGILKFKLYDHIWKKIK